MNCPYTFSITNMKVFISTFGCKANQYDSSMLEEALTRAGHEVCPTQSGAEAVIVNTCTVTSKADYQARQKIRRVARQSAKTLIVAAGCYPRTNPDALIEMPEVHAVIEGTSPETLLDALTKLQSSEGGDKLHLKSGHGTGNNEFRLTATDQSRARAVLKIQDGCDEQCSYCIVPKARGISRSASPKDVIQAVQKLADKGHAEVVLTGIHLGGYGRDLDGDYALAGIVREILDKTDVGRLRLSSVDPMEVEGSLMELFKDDRVCSHLHLPVQSGCDRILASMKRPYSASHVRGMVVKLDEEVTGMAIGMDLIIGYPTETDDDFAETLNFIESLNAAYLHVFPFSLRPGTYAEQLEPKVEGLTIKDRCFDMRILGDRKREHFMNTQLGETLRVAVEKVLEDGKTLQGKSGNYLNVEFPAGSDAPSVGTLVDVVITSHGNGRLYGQIP